MTSWRPWRVYVDPYQRIPFRGVTVNRRTREMVGVAERWARLRGFDGDFELSQGSYTTASAASAGTHAGGGAIDVRAAHLSTDDRLAVVTGLRLVGSAAWLRRPDQADPPWPYHVHALMIGDRELSPAAEWQVQEYLAGRNGLQSRADDDGPEVEWVTYPQELDTMRTLTQDDADFLAPIIGRWLLDQARIPKLSTPEAGDTITLRNLLAYRLDRGTVQTLDQLGQVREVLAAGGSLDTAAIVTQINELPAEIRAELAAALASPASPAGTA